jgi:hypothetical protein
VQWAAFYSDCEHEVLEVTAGHRITLTYNLYLSPGTGLLAGRALSLQPENLPLARKLRSLLANQELLPKECFLGINMVHRYPHTHEVRYSTHFYSLALSQRHILT